MNTYTPQRAERFGGSSGQFFLKSQGLLVIDTPAGALPDQLPASLFSLYKVLEATIVSQNNLAVGHGIHAFDGNSLLVKGATAAPVNLPTGTYLVTVTGY
jgi:hypothetical protein